MQKAIKIDNAHQGLTRVAGSQAVNVWYDQGHDTVAVEVGSTILNMQTSHFFQMHEMMRKAAARLVMQLPLSSEEERKADRGQHGTAQMLKVA